MSSANKHENSVHASEERLLAMTDSDLVRFANAQASVHDQVVAELTEGHKHTHWMWFIFPQLTGLGHSPTAQHYAIQDLDQAKRYLADPILGRRLRQNVRLVMGHKDKSALEILGSPDNLKFRSCLTLFAQAASNRSERMLFEQALHQFYDGPDPRTLQLLNPIPQS
jgi:uncharacterized protein (DUF1810 family)